jgi:pimeloyl-ACP methyl ester carboxylesterase
MEHEMSTLAYTRRGAGEPLVLLHPLGSSRRVWDPVIADLAEHFDVLAVDLPGFGDSDPLPAPVEPDPATLAEMLAGFLDVLDITTPHIAGNSLGGWVALEFAGIRPVSSLTLFAPAGLWRELTPRYCRISLQVTRWLAQYAARPLSRLVQFRLGRIVVLGQTHGRPARMTPDVARRAIHSLGTCAGFAAPFRATTRSRYRSGSPITAPITVAFGSRDLVLLRRQSRHLEELPVDTRLVSLPGCGHIPIADDPASVVATIMTTARPDRAAGRLHGTSTSHIGAPGNAVHAC